VLDADDLIARSVHHQQRLAQIGDVALDRLTSCVLHRSRLIEGAAGERSEGDAVTLDIIEMRLELVQHVGDIRWRADGDDCRCLGMRCAAPSTAAPPSEWPMRMAGA
jgi:hypothetical protein